MPGYLDGVENNKNYCEFEILTEQDRYNDYIITGMRTIWGVSESIIGREFSQKYLNHFRATKDRYKQSGHLLEASDTITLSAEGLFISDQIMADFMVVETC